MLERRALFPPRLPEGKCLVPGIGVRMAHTHFCRVALGAAADRSIRTPTSGNTTSTPQHADQAEEDRLVRIPPEQAVDQFPPRANDLARQPHEYLHERLE